jgi:hypothetical protein
MSESINAPTKPQEYAPRSPEIREISVTTSGDPTIRVGYMTGNNAKVHRQPNANDRNAVLESLYKERSELLRKRRLGSASPDESGYLADLERYIDSVEAQETSDESSSSVWTQLDQLAATAISIKVDIERAKRR